MPVGTCPSGHERIDTDLPLFEIVTDLERNTAEMKGDFSRLTFDPDHHYSAVLIQQGRVLLDAEMNEHNAIVRHRDQIETVDVVGGCGAPADQAGFAISVKDSALQIGAGRYYVDGMLCENGSSGDPPIPYLEQPDFPGAPDPVALFSGEINPLGLVYLDVWQRHLTALDEPGMREEALGADGPDSTTRLKTVWQVKVLPVTLDLSSLITALTAVQGSFTSLAGTTTNPVLRKELPIVTQAIAKFLAGSGAESLEQISDIFAGIGNLRVLFPELRSTNDVADLNAIEQAILTLQASFLAFEANVCSQDFPEWETLTAEPGRTLKARTRPTGSTDDPCQLPPTSGYQRLENQLYRSEILQGGDPNKDTVTHVWSRDNGSVVTSITAPVPAGSTQISVASLGPDNELGFAKTQLVEISDDALELSGQPGQLVTITDIDPATLQITVDQPLNAVNYNLHAKMRRWDGTGKVTIPATPDDWLDLEGGIQIQFAAGTYQSGDYWLVPARTASGQIEWPISAKDGSPLAEPPLGIRHHFCPLALIWYTPGGQAVQPGPSASLFNILVDKIKAPPSLVSRNPVWTIATGTSTLAPSISLVRDCRRLFSALTETPAAMHILRTNWQHSGPMTLTQFSEEGLVVFLDQTPDARALIDGGSIIVTAYISTTVETVTGSVPVILPVILTGTIDTSLPNAIRWQGQAATISSHGEVFKSTGLADTTTNVQGVLIHVSIQGNGIWQAGTWPTEASRPYLDGRALGVASDQNLVDLRFPSGAGVRSSDFESWFYVVPDSSTTSFQVTSVQFLAASPGTPSPDPIKVPPVPTQSNPAKLAISNEINGVAVQFSRQVSSSGFRKADLQKGMNIQFLSGDAPMLVTGTLALNRTRAGVTFATTDKKVLPPGAYRLTLVGDGAAGPLVKATDNGEALDGALNNTPGSNFDFYFTIE